MSLARWNCSLRPQSRAQQSVLSAPVHALPAAYRGAFCKPCRLSLDRLGLKIPLRKGAVKPPQAARRSFPVQRQFLAGVYSKCSPLLIQQREVWGGVQVYCQAFSTLLEFTRTQEALEGPGQPWESRGDSQGCCDLGLGAEEMQEKRTTAFHFLR